ncbi:Ku protein [Streptomyces sp. NPDC001809]
MAQVHEAGGRQLACQHFQQAPPRDHCLEVVTQPVSPCQQTFTLPILAARSARISTTPSHRRSSPSLTTNPLTVGASLTNRIPAATQRGEVQRNYARPKGVDASKPYTLLRQALSRTDKVAVVKYALRGRERLGLLRPVGEALSIQGLHWDDEIRSPAELAPPETDVSEKEIEGALTADGDDDRRLAYRPGRHRPIHRGAPRGHRG